MMDGNKLGIPDTLKLTASLSLKINGLEDESFPSRNVTSGGCHVSFRECSSGNAKLPGYEYILDLLLVTGHPGGRDRSEW